MLSRSSEHSEEAAKHLPQAKNLALAGVEILRRSRAY